MAKTSGSAGAGQLDIRFFGHANVSYGGVPIKLAKRSTTLAMLAFLILRRGKPISREAVAFTLFPDLDEATALAELRRYLYLANKALSAGAADPYLIVDAETVRWNDATSAFVDVVEFERLSEIEAMQAEAIELYAGDFLEDTYDDWIFSERERLRSRYLTVLQDLLIRYRANREFAPAIACARRVLAADPWREDTLRALVALRYESGDTAGALVEYERFVKRLRDELAIAPMPETVAVRQSILRNESVPGSLPFATSPANGRTRPAHAILPFVGRAAELTELHAAWSRAARGTGGFVVLGGEAGVGKTRLAAELARAVQTEGGRVFVGTTSAPESMPYQAIIEALRSGLPLLLVRPPTAARRSVLSRFLPDLRDPGTAEVELPQQPAERETARTYDAFAHAIRGLASPRPLLLVLEDLHWAGSATIEALGALVKELARAPILILATCREEEVPSDHPLRALQRSLRMSYNTSEIELERFDEENVAELVGRVDELREGGSALVRDLYTQSEGNALFLSEAIHDSLEQTDLSTSPAAPTIGRIIAARIERLSEEARTVAEIAAVGGAGCSVSMIREVSNVSASSVARGLDELLDRRILREAGARANYDYVFGHHLIMEAIYQLTEPNLRAQRHSRIARFFEAAHRENEISSPREIAAHYERAGDIERCVEWYLTAARKAAAVHAYGDAIDLATRALENAASDALRKASLDVREKARERRGDRQGQREDIDALGRLAGTDSRERFDVLARRVRLARTVGESEEEGRLVAEMCAVAERLDDAARAQALAQSATHAGLCSRPSEGLEPARAALAIYEQSNDLRGQLECLYLLVDFTSNLGDMEASRTHLALMRDRAASLADQTVESRALAVAATAALLRQEYRECFALTKRALEIQLLINDREGEAGSRGRLAVTAAWLADYDTAWREFDRAMETYESIGHRRGLAITQTNLAMSLVRLGQFHEALRSIERSNAYFEIVQEKRTLVANQVNASFATLHLGDARAAKALAASALTAAREIAYPVFEAGALANLGNAERVLGEIDAAIEHMEAGISIRRSIQEVRDFVDDLADLTLSYVSAGQDEKALAIARELSAIGASPLTGAFWPHYVWWAAAQGLKAGAAHEPAREAAERARAELSRFAERINDARTRETFLSIPINQRIASAT